MVNAPLCKGVSAHGRSKSYHRRGLWAIKAKNGGKFPVHAKKAQEADKATKAPKFYPADDVSKPVPKNSVTTKSAKLRSTITPGTVLIVLSGRFRGKRVVFLKQLESGLLLVTGPFKVNGVPLRRLNQAFVIATSTKIDVSKVNTAKFTDSYFAKPAEDKKKKSEGDFLFEEPEKKELSAEKVEDQKTIDAAVLPLVEAVPDLKAYLGSLFSLKSGDKPHAMSF
ncbi:60S ribosomal protein L6 [Cymbomonas tetramitiformis]|uniref:60S ribosomal protein L6 n=1 Tax=Cymbomonas tetramitiformis TaxID=36881 RepID=A0AAE0L1N1_9CHLO|nr:60S ribosomal protein L6 [Cymbomonas tetramitiformis]